MNVLMIGLDFTLAMEKDKVSGDSHERHIAYGKLLSQLIIVVMGGKAKNLKAQRLSDKVMVHPVTNKNPFSYVWNGYKVCLRICRNNRIDVITTQDPFLPGLIGYFLKKRLGVPLVVQLHGDFFDNPYWLKENIKNLFFHLLGKWLIKRADGIRTVNSGIKQRLVNYGLSDDRIWIIPPPVFLTKFRQSSPQRINNIRQRYSLEKGKAALFVGYLTKAKNIANLLRAAQVVIQKYAETKFLICGDGGERRDLEHLSRKLGVSDNVIFTGEIPYGDLPDYYHACDMFILPSNHESFGLVLIEAGMAKKPVVATDVSGPRDIVLDKITGFLVKPRNHEQLAARIIKLIEEPVMAKELGENARKHILANFDPATGVQRIVDMWGKTVELARGRAG